MKRFLGILVLGLGLVFSTPSYAAKSLCIYKEYKYIYFTVQCKNWSEKFTKEKNFYDNFQVSITFGEFVDFMKIAYE